MKMLGRAGTILLLVGVFLVACQTTPESIPEGLSPMEMFQRAQEAADRDNYDTALRYYNEFLIRYPDDPGPIIEAEYEIAFIAYKQERYDEARAAFTAIIAAYGTEDAALLPDWPLVLSGRLIEEIDARTNPEA